MPSSENLIVLGFVSLFRQIILINLNVVSYLVPTNRTD